MVAAAADDGPVVAGDGDVDLAEGPAGRCAAVPVADRPRPVGPDGAVDRDAAESGRPVVAQHRRHDDRPGNGVLDDDVVRLGNFLELGVWKCDFIDASVLVSQPSDAQGEIQRVEIHFPFVVGVDVLVRDDTCFDKGPRATYIGRWLCDMEAQRAVLHAVMCHDCVLCHDT